MKMYTVFLKVEQPLIAGLLPEQFVLPVPGEHVLVRPESLVFRAEYRPIGEGSKMTRDIFIYA